MINLRDAMEKRGGVDFLINSKWHSSIDGLANNSNSSSLTLQLR
jgi:hypothetical protein